MQTPTYLFPIRWLYKDHYLYLQTWALLTDHWVPTYDLLAYYIKITNCTYLNTYLFHVNWLYKAAACRLLPTYVIGSLPVPTWVPTYAMKAGYTRIAECAHLSTDLCPVSWLCRNHCLFPTEHLPMPCQPTCLYLQSWLMCCPAFLEDREKDDFTAISSMWWFPVWSLYWWSGGSSCVWLPHVLCSAQFCPCDSTSRSSVRSQGSSPIPDTWSEPFNAACLHDQVGLCAQCSWYSYSTSRSSRELSLYNQDISSLGGILGMASFWSC